MRMLFMPSKSVAANGSLVAVVFTGLLLCMLLVAAPPAHAHTLYVMATDYAPDLKWGANMYFGWGHHMPVDDLLEEKWLKDCQIVHPDGKLHSLDNPTTFLTPIKFPGKGTYVLAAQLKPDFFTMYMKDGEMKHELIPKTGLENVVMSSYFCEYAKAIVNAAGVTDTFSKPVGHKLEIIPLENPALLGAGDYLPLRILFDGKPIPGHPMIYATYLGFSSSEVFAYTGAISKGRARIKILRDGVWFVKAELKIPTTGEMAEKCDDEFYLATLTFETGRQPD